ncbi:MAG: methyltransferase domain-containing protein [Thermoplasmata archaeon]|nr:MAG: methyltransferase domain-containing protein [Thermoplasmata archaeon]
MKKNKIDEEKPLYESSFKQKIRIKKMICFWYMIDLLAYKIKKIAELYKRIIGDEYRKEIKKFNLYNAKKILHIGAGSYPLTALILSEINHIKIVTIDNNSKSVKLADKVIQREKLQGRIKIENGDATNYPVDGFDTIIVSGCSTPKIKILDHVFRNIKPDCRVIVREAYNDNDLITNYIKSYQNISFIEKISSNPLPGFRWESLCLKKI